MCNCGCNTCDIKSPLMLNESLAPKQILSEGLKYHMDNNKPLTEHVYRAGSENYFNLWAEARSLYSREILEITNPDDLEILTETHLGHFGILEDGTKVPLDFPMLDEGTYEEGGEDDRKYALLKVRPENYNLMIDKLQDMNINHTRHSGIEGVIKVYTDRIPDKVLYKLTHDVWVDKFVLKEAKKPNKPLNKPIRVVNEEEIGEFPFEYKGFKYNVEDTGGMIDGYGRKVWQVSIQDKDGDIETTNVRGARDVQGHQEAKDFIDNELLPYYGLDEAKKYKKGDKLKIKLKNGKEFDVVFDRYLKQDGVAFGKFKDEYGEFETKPFSLDTIINEAKKKAKKNTKKLNKPMRDSSGGKAYKVYVKDPKTGNIKTVRFGSGGLRAKINDPKARQAFAKRHKCSTKKDKTKASYWSCRLPRYAKLLGLKSNFTGFW